MQDDLHYPLGQPLRPFSDEFRQRWNTAADAAEALYNPQTDAQGQFDIVPGLGLNYQHNPLDASEGAGPIPQGMRMIAMITGVASSGTAGHYTADQAVWDDSASEYIALTNGNVWDADGSDLPDLQCRQGFSGIAVDTPVEVWPEIGDDGLLRWVFDASDKGWYYAKVTASSSVVADITLAELDSAGNVLVGGRTPVDARVPNERKGVPVDTFGIAFELAPAAGGDPVTKFTPWDGLTTAAKDLVVSTVSADSSDWDVEVDGQPVNYLPARIKDDTGDSGNWYFYNRDITTDASGMIVHVDNESRVVMPGDGYNETRHNNVTVDTILSNGVLDFDDQQTPGTDELVVEWTLTGGQDADAVEDGNDGLRTQIQGIVDVSSITGGGGDSGTVLDKEIRVSDSVGSSGTYVIDSDNYSNRMLSVCIHAKEVTTEALWNAEKVESPATPEMVYVGSAYTTGDINLFSITSEIDVYIDVSDGYKLKMDYSSPADGDPGTDRFHFVRLLIQKGDRKTTADHTIT